MLTAIRRVFEEEYGAVEDFSPTPEQVAQMVPYYEKQSSWQWRLGKTPAFDLELDREIYADFCKELETGKKLLYLTDNAGEIGFDRIFAEEIAAKYPNISITFCVRGAIAANDATREDAAAVGIPFPVIDNGNRVAGTILDQLGEEARNALENADEVIAKGMANTETMYGCQYNVYYAFLVKCQKFVNNFGKPMFTPMLVAQNPREGKE
jgi:uncharacterized protein with ATP-grasp and redox domains